MEAKGIKRRRRVQMKKKVMNEKKKFELVYCS
jgi:hypothetical protein